MAGFWDKVQVPWGSPQEWLLWLGLIIVATFFIHNVTRVWKAHQ